jgi:hypothetical protein|tara:strand:+ start:106 stop:213 length:108 start_codon:yes stop_codon:yes gene_type:complete
MKNSTNFPAFAAELEVLRALRTKSKDPLTVDLSIV